MFTSSDIFDYTWENDYKNGHYYDYYRKESRSNFQVFLLLVSLVLIFSGFFLICFIFVSSSFIIRHYYLRYKERVDKGYALKREERREEEEKEALDPMIKKNRFEMLDLGEE